MFPVSPLLHELGIINHKMKTVVGFLSRAHGLEALNALVNSKGYQLKVVYTHSLNPKSQDTTRSKRVDYDEFVNICNENKIPLITIDSKMEKIENMPQCDYIVEVSWRYVIPPEITKMARIAAFGIHRGKLPEYAGAEPIKQALMRGEKEIMLSAHYLDSLIDQGKVICFTSYPVNYDQNSTMEENIHRLRNEITPLFSRLIFKTFDTLENKSLS